MKTIKKILTNLIAGIHCIIALGLGSIMFSDLSKDPPVLYFSMATFFVATAILLFLSNKQPQKQKELHNQYYDNKDICIMKHVNGLPLADHIDCNIILREDRFVFSFGGMHFELELSKIQDICIKTEAALRGQQDAFANGSSPQSIPENPDHTAEENYLIITYLSTEVKCISFEIGTSMLSALIYLDKIKDYHGAESTQLL